LRKTNVRSNSLAHRTTWLRSDFIGRRGGSCSSLVNYDSAPIGCLRDKKEGEKDLCRVHMSSLCENENRSCGTRSYRSIICILFTKK
ncbi:hypothetical protein PTB13_11740, partial [Bacillus sp. MHSD17]|nr:hypothetical protein [Bacillus sp. MHSD17]